MNSGRSIPFSVLDLAPIIEGEEGEEGGNAAQSFRNTLDLARNAERWGYNRYWLAEHHGMPGIASAATAVLIAHIGNGTTKIRIGAGGIMLPNHSPLVIAEQFGTLESLFPGRVDLGLGRAPGSDQATSRALRRDMMTNAEEFPQDVLELMRYFDAKEGDPGVQAVPGAGLHVPIWILGSSLFGAHLAAELGLPYAFASHFAPTQLMPALEAYRRNFRPSSRLQRPYVMLGYNVFAADTDKEGRYLATSLQQAFVNLRNGRPSRLKRPVEGYAENLNRSDSLILEHALSCTAMGSRETIRRALEDFIARTDADELMITSQIYDHAARLRSYEIMSEVCNLAGDRLDSPKPNA